MYKLLLVRYGELGLKGKNKNQFIVALVRNIRAALKDVPGEHKVYSTWARIMVSFEGEMEPIVARLKRVFGIYSLSPVLEAEKNLDSMKEAALKVLLSALPEGGIFKVETRRADKTFPMPSPEISKEIATYLFDHIDQRYDADMHHPTITVQVEIRIEGVYVYGQRIPCAKGLPVGCSGKAALLLSGGIDSPVAGWMAMKRGVAIEAIHFYSYPFTSEQSKEKVIDLCRILSDWKGSPIRLHVVHFTDIQKAIRVNCHEEYGITIMRRMMFRIAEKIARRRKCLALYTGECVGQVASQTLESMNVINNVIDIPVLRPLVGMDKEDIMEYAAKIDTFNTSIQPFEDCCTIFLPAYPKIRPVMAEAEEMEKSLDIEALIADALEKTEVITIGIKK